MKFEYRTSLEEVRLIAKIDEFKGSWRSLQNLAPERLAALKKIATVESIGSSTRIEGAKLSNSEVESLLSGLKTNSFASRDEEEVAGYAELMETVYTNWNDTPFTENQIKYLHGVLLKYSQKDNRHRGNYKTTPNHVEANDGIRSVVVFQTASPFETPFQMTELVSWTDKALEEGLIHPLLVVAVFIVKFLAIHPFQDGNGRLSRALTTLLLLKTNYAYVPYASMESIIEKNKNEYYLALRKTQSTLLEAVPNWEPWVLFFLQSTEKQSEHLRSKIQREKILQGDLPLLSVRILELLRQHGSLKMPQLVNLTDESKSTIRSRIIELEAKGGIIRHGAGKSTWYTLNQDSAPQ